MGPSPYVAAIREKIGSDLLFVPAAGMAVFNDEGRLLLARHTEGERWTSPGGMVEPGESPRGAAIRELLEETGLRADDCELFGAYGGPEFEITYKNGDRVGYVNIMYGCHNALGSLRLEPDELIEARWAFEDEAMDLDLLPAIRAMVPNAFAWWRSATQSDR